MKPLTTPPIEQPQCHNRSEISSIALKAAPLAINLPQSGARLLNTTIGIVHQPVRREHQSKKESVLMENRTGEKRKTFNE